MSSLGLIKTDSVRKALKSTPAELGVSNFGVGFPDKLIIFIFIFSIKLILLFKSFFNIKTISKKLNNNKVW